MDLITSVKLAIYETIAATTHAPTVPEVARQLGAGIDDVQAAFDELHRMRLLVPEPGDPSRIRMAPPFSGVPTPFRVIVGTKTWYANCVWDALGVAAALHEDALVRASDAHTRESISLVVRNGTTRSVPCVIHFAVPAAHWWDDVIYT